MTRLQCYISIMLISCSGILTGLEAYYPKHIESDSMQLRLINVLFRHGDRTLDIEMGESYPNDPHKDINNHPDGDGQLTNVGKRRAFQLGEVLKKRYGDFLGDIYYQPNIYARCTYFPRTKTTLQLVLAGLYPPTEIQQWNPNLTWQPIDLQYAFITNDGLLYPGVCSRYLKKMAEIKRLPEVIAQEKEFDDLGDEMAKYTGKNFTNMMDFIFLYQTLSTEKSLGLTLPEWTESFFPDGRLHDAALFQYKLFSYNKELTRLNGGTYLYKIIGDMDKVINGTLADRKLNLFSAHDVNVVAVLQALGVYNNITPAYTSSVIVELLENDNNYFVKILYYSGIPSELLTITIPGCEILCPYDKFVALTSESTMTAEDPKCPIELPKLPPLHDLPSTT